MPSSVSALPSQLALVGSIVIYPSIFYLLTPRGITPSRFAKNREAISAFHCALMTVLTLVVLQRRQRDWVPPTSDESRGSRARGAGGAENETPHSIISARSGFGNTIIALETGYLLQDTIVLMLGARLRSRRTSEKGLMKELNLRVLVWHHGGIASALGLFQWYVGQGKEKGVLIILMLMLMNTS